MKIYSQDGLSLLEAWYLQADISGFQAECDVLVNPTNRYITNREVIVSKRSFDFSTINRKNTFISRIPIENGDYLLDPYAFNSDLLVVTPNEPLQPVLTSPWLEDKGNLEVCGQFLHLHGNFASVEEPFIDGYLTIQGLIGCYLDIVDIDAF